MRSVLAALTLGVAAFSAAPYAAAQTGELQSWIEIGDMAAVSLDRQIASRQFAKDLLDTGSFDGEMNDYFQRSIESLDRQIARSRELVRMSDEAVARETGSASDPKADAVSGPLQDWLSNEAKRKAVSGPIEEWIAAHEARMERDRVQAQRIDGSPDAERGRAFNEVRASESWSAVQSGRVLQQWTTVVVDSTGEILVDDPRDAIEAKLIDIDSELEQLREQGRDETDLDAQRQIRSRIAALDRELRNTIATLARMVETIDAPAETRVRRDPPVCPAPDLETVTLGCEYWAVGVPIVIPGGDPIIVEKVKLDIDDDDAGRPAYWRLYFYARYQSEPGPVTDEPMFTDNGEVEVGPNGELYLGPGSNPAVDASSFPLSINRMSAQATGVDVIDRGHPLSLSMVRDSANFVDRNAVAPVGTGQTRSPADDVEAIPLGDTPPATALEDEAPPPSNSEDEWLVPLTKPDNPADAESPTVPQTAEPNPAAAEDDWVVPLTKPDTPADAESPTVSQTAEPNPAAAEDDWVVPLTEPDASADTD